MFSGLMEPGAWFRWCRPSASPGLWPRSTVSLRGVLGTNSPQVLTDYALSLFGYSVNGSGRHRVSDLTPRNRRVPRGFNSWSSRKTEPTVWSAGSPEASLSPGKSRPSWTPGNTEAAATWFGWLFTPVNGIDTSPLALQGYSQGALARNPWVMRWLAARDGDFRKHPGTGRSCG